jgi:hypothetical protein
MTREFLGGSSALAAVTVQSVTEASVSGPPVTRHLTQRDLASRWRVSERTLERWRWRRTGPPYLKVGGRVVYRLADVRAYETAQLHAATPADPFFRNMR